ncbi:MAG TPA: hypothetical protein VGG33_26705 [Polyangia bacterium]
MTATRDLDDPNLELARAEVARSRERVAASMVELQRQVALRTDWRGFVARRPMSACAIAFGLGYLIGLARRDPG